MVSQGYNWLDQYKELMAAQVGSIIDQCDTGLARGLNLQCIAKMNRMVKTPLLVEIKHPLININGDQINPFLQPQAAAALVNAAKARGTKMVINSCLRTTVQQAIIRMQFEAGLCGITAAALPGTSNHERGAAIDIQDPDGWEPFLEDEGWVRLGSWDPPHFDYNGLRSDIAMIQISAFQQLWNQHNPKDVIAIDGTYGPVTAKCIQKSPLSGW